MRTLVVSDLHLGGSSGAAVLELPAAREALFQALREVDRLVLLGDVLELRHGPRREALMRARPFFERLGQVFAGREVVVLAGNHDHALVETWLRVRDEASEHEPLGLEHRMAAAEASSMVAALAEWAAPAHVTAAYPGVWLREDVYATHGHQLDCHLTIPTMERLGIGMTARVLQRSASEFATPADYEAVTAPVYAWIDAVSRQAPTGAVLNGESTVRMWRALGGDRDIAAGGAGGEDGAESAGVAGLAALGPALRRHAIARAFPVAVAVLNRAGLGAFNADITTPELRRAGLRAMGEVAVRLGLGNVHVIFGHTHRAGPLLRDERSEWQGPGGARLLNTGCWTYDAYFLRGAAGESPYRPGGAALIEDGAPPLLCHLLDDQDLGVLMRRSGRSGGGGHC